MIDYYAMLLVQYCVCARARLRVHACVCGSVYGGVWVSCVCPSARVGVFAVGAHRPGSCALAAGVTWTSRTASAQFGPRFAHTSVVDAAGAIYVLGGYNGGFKSDVWVSSDGGA